MEKPRSSRQRWHCSFILIPNMVFRCSLIWNQLQSRVLITNQVLSERCRQLHFLHVHHWSFDGFQKTCIWYQRAWTVRKGSFFAWSHLQSIGQNMVELKSFCFVGQNKLDYASSIPFFSRSHQPLFLSLSFSLSLSVCLSLSLSLHIKKYICHWGICIF